MNCRSLSSFVGFGVGLAFSIALAWASGQGTDASVETSKRSTQESLQTAAEKLKAALVDRDADRVLSMMATEGVEFSPDPVLVTLDELRKDFARRGETYANFFDGVQARKNDEAERKRAGAGPPTVPLLSFTELMSSSDLQLVVHEGDEGAGWIEFVRSKHPEFVSVVFEFEIRGGRWRITGLPHW